MSEPKPSPAVEQLLVLIGEVRRVAALQPDRILDPAAVLQRLEAIYKALTS